MQQLRLLALGPPPPALEARPVADLGRQPGIVEAEQGVLVDQQIAPPGAGLQFVDVLDQGAVVLEERPAGAEAAVDQRFADEDLARQRRVDAPVVDLAAADQRQTVERDLLQRHHPRRAFFPVWFGMVAANQMRRQRLDPFRIDPGHGAGIQPAGLDQFGSHQPLGALPEQSGTREDLELAPLSTAP